MFGADVRILKSYILKIMLPKVLILNKMCYVELFKER